MPNQPVPQHCPTPRELDDLELLISGAFAPVVGFNEPGSPIRLDLPADVAATATAAGSVELVDPEGLPLAKVSWPDGSIEALSAPAYGPFRRLHLTPAETHEQYAGHTVVPVTDALTIDQIAGVRELGPVVLLALTGSGTPDLSPVALVRATLVAAEQVDEASVVVVPLAAHGDAEIDHDLGVRVAATYAGDAPVVAVVEFANPDYPAEIVAIIDEDQPAPDDQGLVLFFTGLSGSGKSTLARALTDRLLERGGRSVTSLDGDVVRRNLSAGLSFSNTDRETNIRRIGWVAAEISRHGGIAVVSPIAPFAETRQQDHEMVDEAGGAFFLVHVATPLEECERRDRKGLYAKARRGEIPEFTGISSPYEEPVDADVRVDTTGRTIKEALDDVLLALRDAGYLDLVSPPVEQRRRRRASSKPPQTTADADHGSDNNEPLKVLFVCTANICRSPAMELIARHLAGDGLTISSAGTHGFVDHAMDDVVASALPDDIDATGFTSHRLTSELLEDADLVLTAESSHRTFILDEHPALFRKVFSLGQFVAAAEKADDDLAHRQLLEQIAQQRGTADLDLDIADPYRRGPEAAAAAVDQIERLLSPIIPRLVGPCET